MNILESIKKQVNGVNKNNKVILFGSRARGDFKKDSDWDFLILLEESANVDFSKKFIVDKLYDLELECEQVISPIIYTKAEWRKRSVTPLYQVIKEEGIEVGCW